MADHVDAPESKPNATTDTPPSIPIITDITEAQPCCHPKKNDKSDKISKSDKIMLWATGIIALGTLVSAGAIILQYREMHAGSGQTDALVGYAQRQTDDADKMKASSARNATAAEGFAKSAKGINDKLDAAVVKLNDQIKAIESNTRIDQRAWVGLTFPNLDPKKEISDALPLQVVFQCPMEVSNYGRTPAKLVEIKGNCAILPSGNDVIDFGPTGPKHGMIIRFESLQPTQTEKDSSLAAIVDIDGKGTPLLTTPETWKSVSTAQSAVIGWGYVKYSDSFGVNHWIRFCHVYNAFSTDKCTRYNDSDTKPE